MGVARDTNIELLDLSIRAEHVLKRNGCDTVGDVLDKIGTVQNLMRLRNCGKNTAKEVAYCIEKYTGFTLPEKEINSPEVKAKTNKRIDDVLPAPKMIRIKPGTARHQLMQFACSDYAACELDRDYFKTYRSAITLINSLLKEPSFKNIRGFTYNDKVYLYRLPVGELIKQMTIDEVAELGNEVPGEVADRQLKAFYNSGWDACEVDMSYYPNFNNALSMLEKHRKNLGMADVMVKYRGNKVYLVNRQAYEDAYMKCNENEIEEE